MGRTETAGMCRLVHLSGSSGACPESVSPEALRKLQRTLRVMRDTSSLGNREDTHVMDPVEKTSPSPRRKITMSAPPDSGLVPCARCRMLEGEFGISLSVSCPEAPPGTRS